MKAQIDMIGIGRKYPNDSLAHGNTQDMKPALQKHENDVDAPISA
jgi:hypothetical protein